MATAEYAAMATAEQVAVGFVYVRMQNLGCSDLGVHSMYGLITCYSDPPFGAQHKVHPLPSSLNLPISQGLPSRYWDCSTLHEMCPSPPRLRSRQPDIWTLWFSRSAMSKYLATCIVHVQMKKSRIIQLYRGHSIYIPSVHIGAVGALVLGARACYLLFLPCEARWVFVVGGAALRRGDVLFLAL